MHTPTHPVKEPKALQYRVLKQTLETYCAEAINPRFGCDWQLRGCYTRSKYKAADTRHHQTTIVTQSGSIRTNRDLSTYSRPAHPLQTCPQSRIRIPGQQRQCSTILFCSCRPSFATTSTALCSPHMERSKCQQQARWLDHHFYKCANRSRERPRNSITLPARSTSNSHQPTSRQSDCGSAQSAESMRTQSRCWRSLWI